MNNLNSWWELQLPLNDQIADDFAGLLLFHGAMGIEILSPDHLLPTSNTQNLKNLPVNCVFIQASYDPALPMPTLLQYIENAVQDFGYPITISSKMIVKRIDNEWQNKWKSFFKPIKISDELWIIPSLDSEDSKTTCVKEKLNISSNASLVKIEPGLAFGTGNHETTVLCLKQIESIYKQSPQIESMLDAGCGSGILSIAAAKYGIKKICGIDNDAHAIKTANDNIHKNNTEQSIIISDIPIEQLQDTYQLVVANILSHILIKLAPHLIRCTLNNGTLILSGILNNQTENVLNAFKQSALLKHNRKLTDIKIQKLNEWSLICARVTELD